VAGLDDRFVYLRSDVNRGCTTARYAGYERAQGAYVAILDSDNELFPWALERAAFHLAEREDVDGVAGLYLFDGRVRARVPGGGRTFTPDDFAAAPLPGVDFVGVVRRAVADEWLERRVDYYNLDFSLWLPFQLRHSMLFVDEVWGRYDASGADRITTRPDPRSFSDAVKFVREFRPLVGTRPSRPLDDYLGARWFALRRAGRSAEAAVVGDWLRERGISRRRVVTTEMAARVRRRLPAGRT
jgi:glycosyltransferase involved in cell wall biosynthesis